MESSAKCAALGSIRYMAGWCRSRTYSTYRFIISTKSFDIAAELCTSTSAAIVCITSYATMLERYMKSVYHVAVRLLALVPPAQLSPAR